MLMYGRNQHNIVKQVSCNLKKKIFLKPKVRILHTQHLGHVVSHWGTRGQRGNKGPGKLVLPAVQRVTIALSLCQRDTLSCLLPASMKEWLGKTLDHPQSLARDTHPRPHSRETCCRLPSCTVGGSVSWCSHYEEQYRGSAEN